MNRIFDFLDRMNAWTSESWIGPYLIWVTAGAVIAWVLPGWITLPLIVGGWVVLLYADPTNRLFGRKGERPEDERNG